MFKGINGTDGRAILCDKPEVARESALHGQSYSFEAKEGNL